MIFVSVYNRDMTDQMQTDMLACQDCPQKEVADVKWMSVTGFVSCAHMQLLWLQNIYNHTLMTYECYQESKL